MSVQATYRNGHNMTLGHFELAGEYGIPVIYPVRLNERLEWMRFNHALADRKQRDYGIHFFIDDMLFDRAWHDPSRYALFLRQFPAVMSPDYSMYANWPKAVNIYNHWRKHQLAAFWQATGVTVIPAIGWIDRASFDWCFDGEPEGGTVAVSSVGTQKNPDARVRFLEGYNEMLLRLQPEKIIFFGTVPDECRGNIEHHAPYYETFTKGKVFADNTT